MASLAFFLPCLRFLLLSFLQLILRIGVVLNSDFPIIFVGTHAKPCWRWLSDVHLFLAQMPTLRSPKLSFPPPVEGPLGKNIGSKIQRKYLFRNSLLLFVRSLHYTTSPGIWREKINRQKYSHHLRINHLTSINYKIECPEDGNVLISRQILDALQTKISRGLPTTWRRGVPF